LLVALVLGIPDHARAVNVATESDLRTAILNATDGDTITFTASITLTADLPAVQHNVTITSQTGNTFALDGGSQFRGFLVGKWQPAATGTAQLAISVTIRDLVIQNTKAKGGDGGGVGGAGAGLGGALFVADQATVTLINVELSGNNATGGTGGN